LEKVCLYKNGFDFLWTSKEKADQIENCLVDQLTDPLGLVLHQHINSGIALRCFYEAGGLRE